MQRAEPPSPRRKSKKRIRVYESWRRTSFKKTTAGLDRGTRFPFVEVVNYLGKKDAVPKRILEEMKKHRPELSLTRGQVGSHLQLIKSLLDLIFTFQKIPRLILFIILLCPKCKTLITNNNAFSARRKYNLNIMNNKQHFANGTSFGRSNMQQPHQNHALGTSFENSNMEQQMMTQNLTSSTQQLDHSSSAVCAPIRSGHDGMITPEATRVDECADPFNQQLEVDVQQSSGARDIFPNHGGFLDPFEGIDDPFESIKHPFQEMYEMAGAMTASRSINDSFL
ncbi:hypothetical protein K1719_016636 [Acacia pycnantha]|nr:hypothetical protein K1719_016636 [Acacia pycnantha]